MRFLFTFLLCGLPVCEILVLVELFQLVSARAGFGAGFLVTVGSVIAGGMVGIGLMQGEGLTVLRNLRQSRSRGESPGQTILDGALVFVGGLFFLFPGLVSDLIGLSMVVPWTRRYWREALVRWFHHKVRTNSIAVRIQSHTNGVWSTYDSTRPNNDQNAPIDVTPIEPDSLGNKRLPHGGRK